MKIRQGVESAADSALLAACREATEITGAEFGGRVWLLPFWYLVAGHRGRSIQLAYSELSIRLIGYPRMRLAATVFGDVGVSSHIRWTVRKGLVGRLTFDEPDFEILHHGRFWPTNLDTMSEREWSALSDEVRLGRSLKEAQTLKRLYGTVVGVPLIDPDSGARLGCMTLHTASRRPLSQDEADLVTLVLSSRSPELARQVIYRGHLTARLASA